MDKYCNPQKAFTALESQIVMSKKLKNKDLTKKEKKILTKEIFRLLDQGEKEFGKPLAPPGFYTFKEIKFLYDRYQAYCDELVWDRDYYQKPIRDPIVKAVKKGMYGTSKENFDYIFRMFRIHIKKSQMIKKLKHLQFTTEQEANEKDMGQLYQIIDSYLISKYTSQMIKGLEVIIKKGKVIVIKPDLNALEAQMDNYALMKFFLERTIFISVSLQEKSLSEDKRNEYVKTREKFRENFKFAQMYEVRRARQNEENFENLIDEALGAHKNVMKVISLFLKAGKPYLQDTPSTKEEIFMKEIAELRKVLREGNLTAEERKYFLERESVMEKEIDWEGGMKKILEDFPYKKDHYS